MMLRAQVHAAHDCWRFIVRSGAWSPFTAASSGLSPFTVRSGGCCHFTVRSGHQHGAPARQLHRAPGTQHPAPCLHAPRAQPAPSTGAQSAPRTLPAHVSPPHAQPAHSTQHQRHSPHQHPAPSTSTGTSNLSSPRAQPAYSTSTSTATRHPAPGPAPATCLHHVHSQLTATHCHVK